MTINKYFQQGAGFGTKTEQDVISAMNAEVIQQVGFEVYYLARTVVDFDRIFHEDALSIYDKAFPIEVYLENVEGYLGASNIMSKFGLQTVEQATFKMSKERWTEQIGKYGNTILPNRPTEGDVLYFPKTKSYFEIKFVDALNPFFQFGSIYNYRLECELWNYSSERINTSVEEIDSLETERSLDVQTATAPWLNTDFVITDKDATAQNDCFDIEGAYFIVDENYKQPPKPVIPPQPRVFDPNDPFGEK